MTSTDALVIDVPGLSFSYGGPLILHDLRLQLRKRSRCLLVGANGAGKSTLLTILAGKRMVRDRVTVFGRDAFKDSPKGITYLGTEWANNPVVRGDVLVSELLARMHGDRYPERRDELVSILDVSPTWRMHQVSDGERRRVQLVLELIEPWDLLLMDEVTVDLDVLARSDLLAFLRRETERRDATIVYATHIFDGLGDWPTHVAHIKRGTIVAFRDFYDFPELDEAVAQWQHPEDRQHHQKQQEQHDDGTRCQWRNRDSPLLKAVERWLRDDFEELRQMRTDEMRKHAVARDRVLLGEERPHTRWDELSGNVRVHGDKYYNYWNR